MIDQYKKELEELKLRMEKAEKFAERIPMFKDQIIDEKLTGEERCITFGHYFKNMHLGWGINRGFFKRGTDRYIPNNPEQHYGYFFYIYVNTCDLFDTSVKYGLEKIVDSCPVYFYDVLNSTFYIEDEHIDAFLNALYDWWERANKQASKDRKQEQIDELKKELNRLEKEQEQVI